jgi:acetyl esterase/lipase
MLQNETISIWPRTAPGSEEVNITETVYEGDGGNIGKVSKPTITAFVPQNPNGIAVLILPGGGYTKVVFKKEGTEIAKWLNSFDVTAFLLKYRFPDDGHLDGKNVPLQDAQRALRVIRSNAVEWNINPHKIGVMGFSAGGHLASTLGTNYNKKVYEAVDNADGRSARPNFMVLCYPVISYDSLISENQSGGTPRQQLYKEYQTDLQVAVDTPPTFLVVAGDDKFELTDHSVRFYRALQKVGVNAELHIFASGDHGFALRSEGPVKEWPKLCKNWMNEIGLFK